jgi:RNA polymerase sigma-70 factor (ECF subfamily)
MFTILRRLHIDRHRRARLRPAPTPDEEMEVLAVTPAPEESDLPDLPPGAVLEALDRVPESFRLAVRLRDLDGFSYADIGRILDVPPGTVMSRIHRGRECLRRLLVERMRLESKGGALPPPTGRSGPPPPR